MADEADRDAKADQPTSLPGLPFAQQPALQLIYDTAPIGLAFLSAWATHAAPAPGSAKLTFRRVFKSSSPEFVQITVREDLDTATYEIRQLDEDAGDELLVREIGGQPQRAVGGERRRIRCLLGHERVPLRGVGQRQTRGKVSCRHMTGR